MTESLINGSKTNRITKQQERNKKHKERKREEERGREQLSEEKTLAYPYGGVLGGRDKCLAVLAELAVQHRLGVSQQRG